MSDAQLAGELEIGLHADDGRCEVVLRLTDPGSQVELAPVRGAAALDPDDLRGRLLDAAGYGRALAAQLFADPAVRRLYGQARAVLAHGGQALRVRVAIEAGAGWLHDLRWELLRDPETDEPLATSERVLLSRFMRSRDWRRIGLRARASLRAVVAVAAPRNLGEYGLAAIDVAGEVARARAELDGVAVTVIGDDEPLTLERLIAGLHDGADVLYLVGHGVLSPQHGPTLFLQAEDGAVARVSGAALAERLTALPELPRLVVLASCESAGRADAPGAPGLRVAETSLAPLLADAGVPAVLAMQAKIGMDTARVFVPRFFAALMADGQVEQAMAAARGAVQGRPDWWVPVLYHRLKDGRLWYEPRFTGGTDTLSQWTSLCRCVHRGQVVPVVGPDVDEGLFGGTRGLASGLAGAHGYPNAAHERDDLVKVAQFLSVQKGRAFAHAEVQRALTAGLVRHQGLGAEQPLPRLLDEVVARRAERRADPLRALARLPARIFVTASPETTLVKTIKAAGKQPEALVCRWRTSEDNTPGEPRPTRPPTAEAPLVYHAFGVFSAPDSLVLTQDDLYDYLIATSTYKLIPREVRGALTDSALLFLGFRLGDESFRALFRLIMNLEGVAGLRHLAHVGVQVDPEAHSLAEVERARAYLERYFAGDRGNALGEPSIALYWGTPGDFLAELERRLRQIEAEAAPAREDADGWF